LDGDIYLRFLAFKDLAEFKEELKKKKPIKIDIGAIYNCRFVFNNYVHYTLPENVKSMLMK
jgi:hypothetical protein